MRTSETFWAWVQRGEANDCWEWQGARLPVRRFPGAFSYGRLAWQGRHTYAHHVAWLLTNGPIPSRLWVLHRCDNPPCCNPSHLFLGTAQDNVADRERKGRTFRGARVNARLLTARLVRGPTVSHRPTRAMSDRRAPSTFPAERTPRVCDECGNTFEASTLQSYCSKQCGNRVRMRRHRRTGRDPVPTPSLCMHCGEPLEHAHADGKAGWHWHRSECQQAYRRWLWTQRRGSPDVRARNREYQAACRARKKQAPRPEPPP